MQIYAFVHFVRLQMNKLTSHRPPYSLWVPLSPASSVDTLREGIRWPGTLCEPQNTGTLQTVSVGHSHTDDLGGPSAIGHSPAESTLSVTPHGSERSEVMTRPKPKDGAVLAASKLNCLIFSSPESSAQRPKCHFRWKRERQGEGSGLLGWGRGA